MIIERATQEEISTNVPETMTQKMTVKQSGKLFTLLSDNLYSDKIGSIVRELSCNARDSHIQSKNDNPFDITVPTPLDPMFRIRDYGTGMSKDEIVNVFSCYGESTKQDTNEFIGAFGLGSKTPFAYADSFNITSIHENKKTSYSVYVDSEGFPAITEMFCIDTIESNGFEIFFDVETNDHRSFRYAVDNFLKYFDFPVKVNGILNELHNFTTADNFVFEDENCVVYSCIYYHMYKTELYFSGLLYNVKDEYLIEGFHVIYKFNIGDVDVSLSREELSYTEKTIKNITEKRDIIKQTLADLVLEKRKEIVYNVDFEEWLYKNFNVTWLIDLVCENRGEYPSIYLDKFNKLKFYKDRKRHYEFSYSKQYPKNVIVQDKNVKLTAKQTHELYEYDMICLLKYKNKKEFNEALIQLNQFKIEYDTAKYIRSFTNEELEEIQSIGFEKEESNVKYTTINSSVGYNYSEEIHDSTIERFENDPDKYLYAVKYKGDLVDPNDSTKVLFPKYNLSILRNDLCSDKRIFCFTKAEYNKATKQKWFKHLTCIKEHVITIVKEYKTNESDYYKTEQTLTYHHLINRIEKELLDTLEDELLKDYCLNKKKILDYRLKLFLTEDNWTGIKIELQDENNDVNILNKRYEFLESVSNYSATGTIEKRKELVDVINFIYKRSLENEKC